MSTITKEWLQQKIADMEAIRDDIPFGLGEDGTNTLAALRIALASLEAEPVGEVSEQRDGLVMDGMVDLGGASTHRIIKGASKMKRLPLGTKFYTAPPAPVSVNITRDQIRDIFMRNGFTIKDGQTDLKDYVYAAADELVSLLKTQAPVSVPDAMEMDDDFDSAFEHGKAVGWNAYRAAMLQSFGNSEQLNSPVIPDGWKLVPIDPTKDMLRAGQSVVGFWLNTVHCYSKMLAAAPAAPQQEVK
ncbi:hypothetical protein [Enterobacter asburiae]|uniref:hypothetical protein n=1 Tax=Enterobacter asburiae TaxID=61645 RepID=UPI000AEBA9DA